MRLRSPAVSLAVLLAGAASAAQEPPADRIVRESAGATVIEIPVNVVGKDGKPVAGLTLADFELYDDGKKVPIAGVDLIDLAKPAPEVEQSPEESIPAAARRLWLLVFDLSYTSPSGIVRARVGARRFVTDAMGENDLAAVGTLSVDLGWKLLVNFTRDRRQLASAVDTLGLNGQMQRTTDPLSFAYTPPGPSGSAGGPPVSGAHDAEILENLRDLQRLQKQANDDLQRGRVTKLVGSLAGIGRTLDSARGRKHVLYFSEGFETRLLSGHMASGDRTNSLQQPINVAALDATTPQGIADAAASGEYWKIDSDTRFGNTATRGRMLDALTLFNRSDAVLDAIDISGLRAETDVTGSGTAGSGTDALFAMAAATDGELVRNANALGPELQRLQERTALVYLLVYQPAQLAKPGTFHALKVKARTPGAKVYARSGYYEPRPYQNLSPLERVLAAGDLVTGGSAGNNIDGRLFAAPFASPAEAPQVPVLLEIPGKSLLAGTGEPSCAVQIYVYANDAAGVLTDYLASEMTIDLAKVRTSLEAGGLKFYGTLYLPPGRYAVRALVRNSSSGRAGVFGASVAVPTIPGGPPTLLPPLFQEAPGRWVMIRGNPRPDAPPRPADYPFAIAGDAFIPSIEPTIARDAPARVAVVAYNLGAPETAPAPLEVTAEIVGEDGRSRPATVSVARRSDVERGGGRKIVLDLRATDLMPGRYALKVAVRDPVTRRSAAASSAFEVR